MCISWKSWFGCAALGMFATGCQTQPAPATANVLTESVQADADADAAASQPDADIALTLGKLSAEDRKAVDAQKYCAVMSSNLLGSMGTPLKLEIKGESVFLCCSGCKSKALDNPDETLAAVAKMKADNGDVEN